MYTIKQKPEEFIVEEITIYNLDEEGEYAYFWMKKKNYNTITATSIIADKLNIHPKNIGFAGTKDKNAVTTQIISVRYMKKEKAERFKVKNIELRYIGQGKKPISLGDLEGNKFKIIVRNLDSKEIKVHSIKKIPNYFGPQRFSKDNARIGKGIVTGKLQKALALIDNKEVQDYLDFHPGDYAGALRVLPLKLRKFYVHAYQSYIWNVIAKEYAKTMPYKSEKIPIIGFATKIPKSNLGDIIKKILNKENITTRDFVIKQIPELSAEGGERELFIKLDKVKVHMGDDDLNKGKTKAELEFTLPKGCYATTVLEYLFNPESR